MARYKRGPTDEKKPEILSVNAAPPGGEDSTKSFDFFNLPRELRDQIYGDCLIYKHKHEAQYGVRLRGRRVANPSLLLVSKQFKREYHERAEQKTCLVIVDRNLYHGELLSPPTSIIYARKLEVHIALACGEAEHLTEGCRVLKELRMHRKWIVDLSCKMRHVESITIKLVLDPHSKLASCEQNLLKYEHLLTNVEDLTNLEVFHCAYTPRDKDEWNFNLARTLVMQWSAEDGKLRRVKGADGEEETQKCEHKHS